MSDSSYRGFVRPAIDKWCQRIREDSDIERSCLGPRNHLADTTTSYCTRLYNARTGLSLKKQTQSNLD